MERRGAAVTSREAPRLRNEAPYAYQDWRCSQHLHGGSIVEMNNGNLLCEECGTRYDHRGRYVPDEEES